jgi:hypothetical protein
MVDRVRTSAGHPSENSSGAAIPEFAKILHFPGYFSKFFFRHWKKCRLYANVRLEQFFHLAMQEGLKYVGDSCKLSGGERSTSVA